MRQWYCQVGGQQYGPVPEDQFRAWIAERRVRPDSYVWTEGMAQWQPAASVPGLFGPGVRPTREARTLLPPPGGTGGRSGVVEIISRAWHTMAGRWGIAIGFWLLFWLLNAAAGFIPYIGVIIFFFAFAGPFALSSAIFFLTYVRGGQVDIAMLFAGFRNWGGAVRTFLLIFVYTLGWMLVGTIPGLVVGVIVGVAAGEPEPGLIAGCVIGGLGYIIMAIYANLRYSQAMFLLADNPALSAGEAVAGSVRIMAGNKLRLLGLMLLIGLACLGCYVVICVGWVFLFVFGMPLIFACYACFYDDLYPPPAAEGQRPTGELPVPSPSPELDQDVNGQHQGGTLAQPDEQA